MRIYAHIDPISRRLHYLTAVILAGKDAARPS
jgi:hypothetical protein